MKADAAPVTDENRKNLPAGAKMLVATARNDITIPYYSGVLQHADDTLIQRGGGKGLKIYDEIERDTHASAMLQKRKRVVLSREWELKPKSSSALDVKAADFCRDVIGNLPFDQICEDMLDATLKGFSVSEIVWKRDGANIMPDQIVAHDQRRFAFDEGWNPRLLTWTNMHNGEELPQRKFMVHRFGVKGNNPYGLGLGSKLFWPVLFKREGITFWLHFLEKFASPTVIGFTPYGTLSEEQNNLLNQLSNLRGRSAITAPVGTDIKFLEAARSGSVTYQDFLSYWDKQISICVNGETLTTDIGSSGSRAASETHADQLDMGGDSDSDLLSGTLRSDFLTWLVAYNYPGAGVPSVWRIRQKNERQAADTRKAKADAAKSVDEALIQLVITAAQFDDDAAARDYITSFDLTSNLSDETIDRLIEARFAFMEGGKRDRDLRNIANSSSAFASLFDAAPKKKVHNLACFAETDVQVSLAERLEDAALPFFQRRIDAVRRVFDQAGDWSQASASLLGLAALWSPDRLAATIRDCLDLSAMLGREAVFQDVEDAESFADVGVFKQQFKEQIDFLKQKRTTPTKAWTDAMRGMHDRAFVIAGATDLDMLSDFQNVIVKAIADGTTLEDFRKDFDRIVSQYGWSYKGERGWRTRVIFETNVRTSYMAGRLKQMRDPDVVRLRPFWQYRHGETRVPLHPRKQHLAWHGTILRYDDPWWEKHFPPNGWVCSCGVRTLSESDLTRLGKTGPDQTPGELFSPTLDPVTGQLTEKPQGIDYGWDYMPGHLWEQGLTPALIDNGGALIPNASRFAGSVGGEPISNLLEKAKPFQAEVLDVDTSIQQAVDAFLEPFGASSENASLFEDKAGNRMAISEQLFQSEGGALKIPSDQKTLTPLMAETLIDPDEIWLGVSEKVSQDKAGESLVERRYLRVDETRGLTIVMQMGQRAWNVVVERGGIRGGLLDVWRNGKLAFKRK
ncbi:phage portal protein family protein [Ochrobactrum chromiisoli]|uniref:DUF935 family protein n=1 Tax=Ochrobactrum chromiisoli TaxID=2993941 RepID=A0ABT3QN80_9HYPH|nr:DUF935 family protein [Ochrobactrum chromiisoli]MCX2697064.1 DUF935 family protein [Ochrobactrum chromiisoli]